MWEEQTLAGAGAETNSADKMLTTCEIGPKFNLQSVIYTCNTSIQEVEASWSEVQSHPHLNY